MRVMTWPHAARTNPDRTAHIRAVRPIRVALGGRARSHKPASRVRGIISPQVRSLDACQFLAHLLGGRPRGASSLICYKSEELAPADLQNMLIAGANDQADVTHRLAVKTDSALLYQPAHFAPAARHAGSNHHVDETGGLCQP